MTLTDRLGTLRFYQVQGAPYTQIIRESLKPASVLTFLANWLGLTPTVSVVIGVLAMAIFLLLDVTFGVMVTQYHKEKGDTVYGAQMKKEWEANPVTSAMMDHLKEIAENTRVARA